MSHLPKSDSHQDECLHDGPPQNPLIGALTGLSEAFFTILKVQNPNHINNIQPQGNLKFSISSTSTSQLSELQDTIEIENVT